MEMRSIAALLVALLILITLASAMVFCQPSPEDERRRVAEAYEAVLEAYEAGGNVSVLVDRLNSALDLIAMSENSGDPELLDEADSLVSSVLEDAPRVIEQGLPTGTAYTFSTARP